MLPSIQVNQSTFAQSKSVTKSSVKSCNSVHFLGVVYAVVITVNIVLSQVKLVVSQVKDVVSQVNVDNSLGLVYSVVGFTLGVNVVVIVGLILFI